MKSKAMIFAKRNLTEMLRSPVSWIFGLALPVGIFAIMQIIVISVGKEAAAHVPMFGVERFTGGALLFGASFLGMFCALLISADRTQSFLPRLFASPMKPVDYIVGYMLAALPLAVGQNVITFAAALCFGLTPTPGILLAMVFSVLFSLLFISIGVIFGSVLSAKNAPPLCSVVVQVAALLSGMWFDLDAIGGGFSVFCHVLPFAHLYDLVRYTLAGELAKLWLPLVVVAAYTIALTVGAVLVFRHKMKRA